MVPPVDGSVGDSLDQFDGLGGVDDTDVLEVGSGGGSVNVGGS